MPRILASSSGDELRIRGKRGRSAGEIAAQRSPEPHANPRLPMNILILIAEHLTGQHAFRTAANLAVTSHQVYQALSPVVFETVLYGARVHRRWKKVAPTSLKHTKFMLLETEDHSHSPSPDLLPQLVMAFYASATPHETGSCYVHLYRPVSSATVFTILATPIRHPSTQDHMCLDPRDREKLMSSEITASEFYAILWFLRSRCGASWTKAVNRPVQAIRKVYLHPGASLRQITPLNLRDTTTDLVLFNGKVSSVFEAKGDPIAIVDTTIELLKLSTIQAHPEAIRNAERNTRYDKQYWATVKKHRCLYSRPYAEWHISLRLESSAKDSFVNKFKEAARRSPFILQNRITIKTTDPVEPGFVSALLFRLASIYEETITSYDQVLPSATSDLGLVLNCEAFTISKESPALLSGLGNRVQSGHIGVSLVNGKISVNCQID